MGCDCLACKCYWLRAHFLLVARSDHTTGSRNIKPEVVFKVQKMARYASFCLIMGPFKGEVPVFARLWPIRVRVRFSFTSEAVRSVILATAWLLVYIPAAYGGGIKRRCNPFVRPSVCLKTGTWRPAIHTLHSHIVSPPFGQYLVIFFKFLITSSPGEVRSIVMRVSARYACKLPGWTSTDNYSV